MGKHLSFFNFSLEKLLCTEESSFNKAKIKILYVVLLLSVIKTVVVVFVANYNNQSFQLSRGLFSLTLYLVFLKILLANAKSLKPIAHSMILYGVLIIFSVVFISAGNVNIITLQFVFMLTLSSFYLLGSKFGILYSLLGALPVTLYMLSGRDLITLNSSPDILASPGYEIIIVLNFITIIFTSYLFHEAFVANVSEKEILNQQLEVAVKEANAAAKSKTDFLSTMSHELRTPLNSVLGMTDLFLNDTKSSEKEENLKILKFSALSLHSLINDILDFNKLGSNKLNLESVSVNLYELVNNVCTALKFQAKEKSIQLIVDIDESVIDQNVITDPIRITQIIYNLVGNAIKFTTKGSVTVRLKALDKSQNDIKIKFSIIDTGIGINSDKQELIFEAFHQASSSTSRNYGGTGLGLSIVKQLLKLFGSDINLRSTPDLGSDFFFEISFKLDKNPLTIPEENTETDSDLSHLKILVAEDNLMNRLLMKKVFAQWNNDLVFVENGQEAIDRASKEIFDVILMDLYMPLVDGYQAAKAIRNLNTNHKNVHIIAFTASVSNSLYDDVKAAGMNDCICKPFNVKDLYKKMKEIKVNK